MNFEWHKLKAEDNLENHGVSFEEAKTVFEDEMQFHYPDYALSFGEERFICLGRSNQFRLLMIVYTEKTEDTIHIISAREATRREENYYVEQSKDY